MKPNLILSFLSSIIATVCILLGMWLILFKENYSLIFVLTIVFCISLYFQLFFETRPEIKDRKIFNDVYNRLFTVAFIFGYIIITVILANSSIWNNIKTVKHSLGIIWLAYLKVLDLVSHTICLAKYLIKNTRT